MTTKLNLREWATYLGVIRRRWIWVAAVFFPVSAAVAVTVFFLPRSFEADALILIERREPLMRKIPGGYDFDQYLLTLRQMMMSETNLRAIASKADMDLGKNEKALRGLVEKLQKSVYFKNKGRDLFEVRVSGDTAQEAYVLAGTVSSHLVETSLAIRRREAGVAYDFIQKQLENFRSKLQEAEERLKFFKAEHVEEMPGTENTNLSRLQQTKTELQAVQLQVRELAEKRTQLKEQIEMEEPMILASTDSAPAGMRVGQLEAMLAQALLRYTEKHPDVARLKAEIEAAKGAVAKGGKAAPTGNRNDDGEPSLPATQGEPRGSRSRSCRRPCAGGGAERPGRGVPPEDRVDPRGRTEIPGDRSGRRRNGRDLQQPPQEARGRSDPEGSGDQG